MTENPEAAWVQRLHADRRGARTISSRMITGHLHRPIVTRWAGTDARRLPVDRAAGRARPRADAIPTRPTTGR